MIETILFDLQTGLIIMGIWATTLPNMILSDIRKKAEKLPKAIAKPLILCPVCMASFWGSMLYLRHPVPTVSGWIISLFCLVAILKLLTSWVYVD